MSDLNLGEVNLRNRVLPMTVVDMMVGRALRTNQLPLANTLPDNWPPGSQNYKGATIFHHGLATLTINYQRSARGYAYFQFSRGWATGNVYRAGITSKYLSGEGTSRDYALGYKFFRRGTDDPRYAIGLELRYSRLDVPQLDDPERLSPIAGLQQRSVGVIFTFGPVFVGRAPSADRAKRALSTGASMGEA